MISLLGIVPLCFLYYNHVFDVNPLQLLSIVVRIVLALICIVPSGLLAWSIYRLFSILTGTKHAKITFSPHKLSFAEVLLAMFMMITKPLYSRFINNKASTDQSGALTLSSPFCITYPDDVVKWDHALGNGCSITGTPMLPLFLAAVTEPAMLLLLMHPRCPINALGAVNVRNRFSVLRPDLCQIRCLTGRNCAGIVAKFSNEPRPVKRGIEYDLEVSVMMPDMALSESARVAGTGSVTVFRQVFTILELRRSNVAPERTEMETQTKKDHMCPRPSTIQPLRISVLRDDPQKWAALCRDYNFIHFSGLAAKAFGLPGRLAHGNHVVARAMMHRLISEKYIPRAEQEPTYMEVRFKRPVVIPNELDVETQRSSERPNDFTISSHGRTCVVVEYGTLEQLLLAGEVEE
jgi:acyl dehydratase